MKVAIIGYGKMGREIHRVLASRGHEVALIIDPAAPNSPPCKGGVAARRADGVVKIEELWQSLATDGVVDVAIEFTTPEAAFENIKKCLEIGVPVVCGTTAWTTHLPEVEEFCRRRKGSFFYASNYSIGVNVAFELNRRLAEMMNRFPEYDVTVEEVHHVQKKDAPSGTAITLAHDIVAALDRKTRWVLGCSADGAFDVAEGASGPAELEVVSVRRSVAPGTHTVVYESPVDSISLIHNIKSRAGLAAGAVSAAEFLVAEVAAGRSGVFSMSDLLKL